MKQHLIFFLIALGAIILPAQAGKQPQAPENPAAVDGPAVPDLQTLLDKQRQALELELLQTGQPYFICDLAKGTLEIKVKGIPLRQWPADELNFSGDPILPVRMQLQAKNTEKTPQRDKIKPGEPPAPALTKSGKFLLTSYEIEDMPDRFSLLFNDDIELRVLSTENARKTGFQRFMHKLAREALVPLQTLFSRYKKRRFTRIDWIMPQADDARALFWVCNEKIPWVFVVKPR